MYAENDILAFKAEAQAIPVEEVKDFNLKMV